MEELIKYEEPVLEAASCYVDKACYKAKIKTENSLVPLMPYLNAVAKIIFYEPEEPVIVFKLGGYKVAVRPNELALASVPDLIEGREAMLSTVSYLNDLWKRRESITPNHRRRKRPNAFDIYKMLPKTNCKACSEPSCLAFATKLALAEVDIDLCVPLNDDMVAKERIIKLIEGE
ncbi:MAG: (Fe-S)-binding protein [Dissulfurimicrobium sp.]|uniref:(Fe-S)-binding protein n=1 Tax=Dissulfurimicrobium sp. TaxID=2022436 RepID=UPI00404A27E0